MEVPGFYNPSFKVAQIFCCGHNLLRSICYLTVRDMQRDFMNSLANRPGGSMQVTQTTTTSGGSGSSGGMSAGGSSVSGSINGGSTSSSGSTGAGGE